MFFFRIQNLGFLLGFEDFEATSNIKYVLKTGNSMESAGKDRATLSLRIKKPNPVKIDLLVTNGFNCN